MYECIDRLTLELQARSKPLKKFLDMFECAQIKFLPSEHNNEEAFILSVKLTRFYEEISHHELILEIPRLKSHLKAAGINLDLERLNGIRYFDFYHRMGRNRNASFSL